MIASDTLTSLNYSFINSSTMTEFLADGHFKNVTDFYSAWYNCSSLTSFPLIDTSSGTNFSYTWGSCPSLPSCPGTDGTVTIPAGAITTDMCNGI